MGAARPRSPRHGTEGGARDTGGADPGEIIVGCWSLVGRPQLTREDREIGDIVVLIEAKEAERRMTRGAYRKQATAG